MILIDSNKGVLTESDEFKQSSSYVIQKEAQEVKVGDIYRVHDYNYLMKVMEISKKLQET